MDCLKSLNLNNYPDLAAEVSSVIAQHLIDKQTNQMANAFVHNYEITPVDEQRLQDMFESKYIMQATPGRSGGKVRLRTSAHPILAILNDYCNHDATETITKLKDELGDSCSVMTIGDSISPKISRGRVGHVGHNCMLLDSARDKYRVVNTGVHLSDPVIQDCTMYARDGTHTYSCVKGTQNCGFRADVAFAVHSMYDFTCKDIAKTFEAHGLTKMVVYLYLPMALKHERFKGVDELAFVTKKIGDKILFNMRDASIPYLHDRKCWEMWSKFTSITTSEYRIIRENVRSHGPLHIINLVKVAPCEGDIWMSSPFARLGSKYYLIPDMLEAARHKFARHQSNVHHYVVPRHVVDVLMNYSVRQQDEGYTYTELATVAGGLQRSIKIGSVVYADRWNCTPTEFHIITISIFLIGAFRRMDRTTTISQCFKHVKEWSKNDGLKFFFRQHWQQFKNSLDDAFGTADDTSDLGNSDRIWLYSERVIDCCDVSLDVRVNTSDDKTLCDYLSDAADFIKKNRPFRRASCDWDDGEGESPSKPIKLPNPPCKFVTEEPSAPTIGEYFLDRVIHPHNDVIEVDPHYKPRRRKVKPSAPPMPSDFQSVVTKMKPAPDQRALNLGSARRFTVELTSLDTPLRDQSGLKIYRCVSGTNTTSEYADGGKRCISDIIRQKEEKTEEKESKRDEEAPTPGGTRSALPTTVPTTGELDTSKSINRSSAPTSSVAVDDDDPIVIRRRRLERIEARYESLGPVPTTFNYGGHCLLIATYIAGGFKATHTPAEWISATRAILTARMYDVDDDGYRDNDITRLQIEEYIRKGVYDANSFDYIATSIANAFFLRIRIVDQANDNVIHIGNDDGRQITIYHKGEHYTATPQGGSISKFPDLIEKIGSLDGLSVIEVSAAPGYLSSMILQKQKPSRYVAGYYKPGDKFTQQKVVNKLGAKIVGYDNIRELRTLGNFDVIISDAARQVNSEAIVDDVVEYAEEFLSNNGTLVIKTFGNPLNLWRFGAFFQYFATYVTGVGTEVYYIFKNRQHHEVHTYQVLRRLYAKDETVHSAEISLTDIDAFAQNMFKDIKVNEDIYKIARKACDSKKQNIRFSVNAITGYASASKTVGASQKYGDALWIAPTCQLRDEHSKLKLVSHTPHTALKYIKDFDSVVVDEISTLPVEYLAMIKLIKDVKIIVVGDVYQTPHVNFVDKRQFTSIRSLGVVNNMNRTYRIPKDVVSIINDKFGYDIETEYPVDNALCTTSEPLSKLIEDGKFKFICFNDSTMNKYRELGANCNTITTYQGSRTNTVVFVIDDKSVTSNLNQRVEWVYTALTRGTGQLILYGDTKYITQYLGIANLPVRNLQEINRVYYHADGIIKTMENSLSDNQIKAERLIEGTQSVPVTAGVAMNIASRVVQCANPSYPSHAFLQPPNLPPVLSGSLQAPVEAALHTHRSFKGYQLFPQIAVIKQQVSNDPKTTMDTQIKRYSKNIVRFKKRMENLNVNMLFRGLMKALYGNDHSSHKFKARFRATPDELLKHARDYLIAAQQKANANPSYLEELNENFSWFEENLQFFNKRQNKFDATPGFDTSDKSGQGVAAMSKRVNFLFSVYARYMLSTLREIARENGRRLIFATHLSDAEIADEYAAAAHSLGDEYDGLNWICTDVSEWDASFQPFMSAFSNKLLKLADCPDELADIFLQFRLAWTMVARTKVGPIYLRGFGKQFSGSPFTIFDNTVLNLALMFTIYEFDGAKMILVKGDDLSVLCKDCKMSEFGKQLVEATKHKVKMIKSKIGEFAGYILTKVGMFPDVVRYACKFLGRTYRDEEHFNETRDSVQSTTAVVKDEHQLNVGAVAYAVEHKSLGVTYDDVITLFNFCKNAGRILYSHLTPVAKPVLSV